MSPVTLLNSSFINEHNRHVSLSTAMEYSSPLAPKTLREVGYRALYRSAVLRANAEELQSDGIEFCDISDRLATSQLQRKYLLGYIKELEKKHLQDNERQTGWYNSLVSQIHALEDYIDNLGDEKFALSLQVQTANNATEAAKAEIGKRLTEATQKLSLETQAKYNVEICLRQAEKDITTSTNSVQVAHLENAKTGNEVSRLSDALSASKAEVEKLKKALTAEKKNSESLQSSLFATTRKNIELVRQLSEKEDRLVGLEMERDMGRSTFSTPQTPRSGHKSRSMHFFGFHRGDSPRKKNSAEGTSQ